MQGSGSAQGGRAEPSSRPLVELLVVPGCPNGEPYLPRLRQLAASAGGVVRLRVVADEAQARAVGFTGSPTVRVDGVDVDPQAGGPAAMTCRLYRSSQGVSGRPPQAWVLDALDRARRDPGGSHDGGSGRGGAGREDAW